jgi:hypothetical protein
MENIILSGVSGGKSYPPPPFSATKMPAKGLTSTVGSPLSPSKPSPKIPVQVHVPSGPTTNDQGYAIAEAKSTIMPPMRRSNSAPVLKHLKDNRWDFKKVRERSYVV